MSIALVKKYVGINGIASIWPIFNKIQSTYKWQVFNTRILAHWGGSWVYHVVQAQLPLETFIYINDMQRAGDFFQSLMLY